VLRLEQARTNQAIYCAIKICSHDLVKPKAQQFPPRIEICPVLGRMACVGASIQAKNFPEKNCSLS
jgi:hypothetical protein